jgi:hypothetical protein
MSLGSDKFDTDEFASVNSLQLRQLHSPTTEALTIEQMIDDSTTYMPDLDTHYTKQSDPEGGATK